MTPIYKFNSLKHTAMKTRILSIIFLSLCCICGSFIADARPRSPKVSNKIIQTPPPPPVKPGKMVPFHRPINPVGHIYGISIPGRNIVFNFSPNGRVYREGDNIGRPFSMRGNIITVYSDRIPQKIIGTGKISRDGKNIEWSDFSNGMKYRLRIIG